MSEQRRSSALKPQDIVSLVLKLSTKHLRQGWNVNAVGKEGLPHSQSCLSRDLLPDFHLNSWEEIHQYSLSKINEATGTHWLHSILNSLVILWFSQSIGSCTVQNPYWVTAVLLREVPNQHCRDPTSRCRPAGDYKLPVMIRWKHTDLDTDDTDM